MCTPQLRNQAAALPRATGLAEAGALGRGGPQLTFDPARRQVLALAPFAERSRYASSSSVQNMLTAPGAPVEAPMAAISSYAEVVPKNEARYSRLPQNLIYPGVEVAEKKSGPFNAPSKMQPDHMVGYPLDDLPTEDATSKNRVGPALRPIDLLSKIGDESGTLRRDDVPEMPKPRPRPIFDGTDEWGAARSTRTSDDDDNYRDKVGLVRKGRFVGYHHAADFLGHFLDNSGADMHVSPQLMLNEIPPFKASNDMDYRQNILDATSRAIRQNYRGRPIKITIPGRWNAVAAEGGDWYYAMHEFDFVNTAVVHVVPASNGKVDVSIDAKLYVYDKYNWDPNKQARVGYFGIDDEEMARLHQVGLAREYDVRGSMRYPRRVWHGVDPARAALRMP